jgi:hypothetical protein
MNTISTDDLVFYITVEQIQNEALKLLGRKITSSEIYAVSKGIEAGLNFDIDTVYETCFQELENFH